MKKLALFILMLAGGLTTASAQEELKPAEISFEKVTHDFGEIAVGEPVTCTFSFTNVGERPLVVNQAIATCGCTVPTYTREPIQPGGKGEIKITYNGQNKGHFSKTVTVRTNGAIELTKLQITGDSK